EPDLALVQRNPRLTVGWTEGKHAMRLKTSLTIAGAAILIVAAIGGYEIARKSAGMNTDAAAADFAVTVTPPGITLTALGSAMGKDGLAHVGGLYRGASAIAYSDANGLTLYTYDKDTEPGKSACSGE